MTRGTKILLFSLLGGLTLIMLVCGGLIYVGFKGFQELPRAMACSDAFLEDLNQGKVDAAYKDSTTAEFRRIVTVEKFRDLVAQYPAFTKQTKRTVGGMRMYGTNQGVRAIVQYNLANPSNTLAVSLILKKDNNLWKVESVNFP